MLAIVCVLCSIETGILCVHVTCALANEPLVCFGVKGVRFEGKEGREEGCDYRSLYVSGGLLLPCLMHTHCHTHMPTCAYSVNTHMPTCAHTVAHR